VPISRINKKKYDVINRSSGKQHSKKDDNTDNVFEQFSLIQLLRQFIFIYINKYKCKNKKIFFACKV